MPDRENCDHVAFITIKHDISRVAKLNEPLAKTIPRRLDWSPNTRIVRQWFHALANSASRTPCRITIFWGKKCVDTSEVAQRGSRPNDPHHNSTMGLGRLAVLTVFKTVKPCIGLFRRDVQSSGLVFVPGSERVP